MPTYKEKGGKIVGEVNAGIPYEKVLCGGCDKEFPVGDVATLTREGDVLWRNCPVCGCHALDWRLVFPLRKSRKV